MEATLAELAILLVAVWLIYAALTPLRDRVEGYLLRLLDPGERGIIDVPLETSSHKKKRE